MCDKEKMNIVTEVGVFGELNVKNPTAKEVNDGEDETDIDALIAESIEKNKTIG